MSSICHRICHRNNINCNHVISSSFFGSKKQSSSFVESDQQISSAEIRKKQVFSSISESLPTKISKMECQSLNMVPPSETLLSETPRSGTPSTSTTSCSITPSSEKRNKSRAGSATYVAKTKLDLEKQWLEHLKVLAEKSQKENEKLK